MTNGGSVPKFGFAGAALALLVAWAARHPAGAQTLRYDTHREVAIPEYAVLRIGPFYSDVIFRQSAGYRYTSSRGAGSDFLREGRRGRIRRDGYDFPLISTLDFRNYLLISRRADMDLSVRLQYEHYPRGAQDDAFIVSLPDEGIVGTLSTSFQLTPYLRGTLYDRFMYRTDWVDTRGIVDESGGRKYEFLENTIGADMDWRMAAGESLSFSAARFDHWPRTREFKDQERTSYRQSLAYSRTFRSWLSGGARARFEQTEYAAAARTGFDSQLYSLFADLLLTRRVTASGWFGYSIVRPRPRGSDGDDGREGFDWGASLKAMEGFWIWWPQMTHEVGASRTVTESFESAYQTADRYYYRLGWNGTALKAGAGAALTDVEPSDPRINAYRDILYTADASYPLTAFARVYASGSYRVRRNERAVLAADAHPESLHDHETWSWRAGTGFAVTRKIDFDTFYQYTERFSNNEDLQYSRDVFQAMLTYSHRF